MMSQEKVDYEKILGDWEIEIDAGGACVFIKAIWDYDSRMPCEIC